MGGMEDEDMEIGARWQVVIGALLGAGAAKALSEEPWLGVVAVGAALAVYEVTKWHGREQKSQQPQN